LIKPHSFIFSPGKWLGEGKIHLNQFEEELPFFTRWTVQPMEEKEIECMQEIQVKGLSEIMVNHFRIFQIASSTFSLVMDNHAIGTVEGAGILHELAFGWEFRVPELGFEGFEYYEQESEESYRMRGEFATTDQLRTTMKGRIWKQKAPSSENSCTPE
jgi:hypothetical protein